jgi:branched-chain amino acid transport system substrate-binding protein
MRYLSSLLAAGIAALALSIGAGIHAASAADNAVNVPVILSVSGSAAFIGREAYESVQLIAGLFNAHGGIRGKTLHLVLQDTTSSPATAVQLFNQAISAHAQAIFGPTFTAECNAVAPLLTAGPNVTCFSPGVHPKPGTFMFSGGVGSDGMAQAIATYFSAKGYTHIALISSTDASGQDFEENWDKALAEPAFAKLQTVVREHFSVSDISVNAQMTRIKTANPQAVILWTAGTGAGVALHAVHDVGIDVPILLGNANMVRSQLIGYTGFVPRALLFPGILGMTPIAGETAGVKAAQAVWFKAYGGEGIKPDLPGALSWDLTMLQFDAYSALGWNATSEQIRSWISSQKSWSGVNGLYDFAKYPQRGIGAESCIIARWDPQRRDFIAVSGAGGTTH